VQGGGYSFVEAVVAIIDTLQEKRALHHKIAKLVGPEEQQQHQQRVLDKFAQGKDRSPEEEIRQKEFVDDLKILWERTVKRGHILLDRAEEEKIQRDNSALLKTISELHRVVEHMDKVGDFLIKPAELELQELEQEPRHGYFLAARYSCPIFRRSRGT
jgi:FKBP-type peptidyl-prolyl cis-trans isomerase (trigger factor)